jgi:hypothetical protein
MIGSEMKTVMAGLVRHAGADMHVQNVDAFFGTPMFVDEVIPSVGEVLAGRSSTYSLAGHEGAVERLFDSVRAAGVLDHPRSAGNLMAHPYFFLDEGQSALVAAAGMDQFAITFPTSAPPAALQDALRSLDELGALGRAGGELAQGGAAAF